MDVTELPKSIDEREVQLLNAYSGIEMDASSIVTDVKDVHESNANCPIDVTVEGMMSEDNAESW